MAPRGDPQLPWVPGAFHARFPVSVEFLAAYEAPRPTRKKKPLVPRVDQNILNSCRNKGS